MRLDAEQRRMVSLVTRELTIAGTRMRMAGEALSVLARLLHPLDGVWTSVVHSTVQGEDGALDVPTQSSIDADADSDLQVEMFEETT